MASGLTEYREWFFTTNATSNVCPTFPGFKCTPPNACAKDSKNGRQWCCDAGSNSVCWGPAVACSSDGSTFTCGSGSNTWCCRNGREQCTQTTGQINICWSTQADPLQLIDIQVLQSVHSSLSSQYPSSSTLLFDAVSLVALTSPGVIQQLTTSTSTTSSNVQKATEQATSKTITTSPASTSSSSTGRGLDAAQTAQSTTSASGNSTGSTQQTTQAPASLSAGAIAGIAIGAAAGMALIVAGLLTLWWREKRKQYSSTASTVNGGSVFGFGAGGHQKIQSPISPEGAAPGMSSAYPSGAPQYPPGAPHPGAPHAGAPYSAYPPSEVAGTFAAHGGGAYPYPQQQQQQQQQHPHNLHPGQQVHEYYNFHSPSPQSPENSQQSHSSPHSAYGPYAPPPPSELPGHMHLGAAELPTKNQGADNSWQGRG